MIARVVVDVPAKETDRPFDYLVPETLQPLIAVGCRVAVPFGARKIQGFVIELADNSEIRGAKLKEIDSLLDLEPPLSKELVELSAWMSEKYACRKVTALQAMIPGALKSKYERMVTVNEALLSQLPLLAAEEQEIVACVRKTKRAALNQLLKRFPSRAAVIKRLIQEGILSETAEVRDRLAPKTALVLSPAADSARLRQAACGLPANARKQKAILEYLIDHPEPVRMRELMMKLDVNISSCRALADKGLLQIREEEELRDPYAGRSFVPSAPLPLSPEQERVFMPIREALQAKKHQQFLLHGVTGSGKTEIYLQLIAECLRLGREAIVLVPEIALTPQMVERFKSRFGAEVAVLHSRLSQGERYDEWRKIHRGLVKIAIGARSAVFAPFRNIGLIIVDEEHESSYKQEESPKYHARDVARRRGEEHRAAVVLGSATPSLESYALTRSDIRYLSLPSRVGGRPLPPVKIVDMRQELKEGNRSMFSRQLYRAVRDRLEKKEQIVLLMNRRGYSTFILCRSCGYVAECPHCDIALTYHRHSRNVRCHYCGYAVREMDLCPECGSGHIRYFGTGTQRVEEELHKLFPGVRIIRMDVDTTAQKGAHEKWLTKFRNHEADILLGTQMVAKGLDFPKVTLVGVIAADTVLHLPDFRAAEKTFQLLTQVAGRAGRHELAGEVIIQTYNPDHYSIVHASRHDYTGFARKELLMRKERGYPPFCQLILLTLNHEDLNLLVRASGNLAARLKELGSQKRHFQVFGPVASPIPRIKDRYRMQCMIKYDGDLSAVRDLERTVSDFHDLVQQKQLQISIDVDPYIMM